ncbi:hypothetical protein VTI28DRAFT_8722 [Corynascus sepedonium]
MTTTWTTAITVTGAVITTGAATTMTAPAPSSAFPTLPEAPFSATLAAPTAPRPPTTSAPRGPASLPVCCGSSNGFCVTCSTTPSGTPSESSCWC